MKKLFLTLFVALFLGSFLVAQRVTTPPASKKAKVMEQIGLTEVVIDYSRPGVKGREGKIWGGLVPYDGGNPFPWRAGANNNTIISFSGDVKINGQALPKGDYGIHVIASEAEWTFIFSHNTTQWGSYNYDPAEDALRVTSKAETCAHTEWLKYEFTNQTNDAAAVELSWETRKAGFTVSVDLHETVLTNIRNELKNLSGFDWRGWNSAANYCLQNEVNLEEGLQWAQYSINGGYGSQPNFTNHMTKSGILEKLGRAEEANQAKEEALAHAGMVDMHNYGRQLIQQKKPKEAMKIFEMNRKKFPNDNFTTLVGMARGYQAIGEKKKAAKHFRLAAENAPTNQKQAYLNMAKKLEEKT